MRHLNHAFNVDLAKEVGIPEAILLNNIYFWWNHNMKTGKNQKKGKYWTFNSASNFTRLFPYMGRASIARYLRNLEDTGYLISDNTLNKLPFDRTKWYTLTPAAITLFNGLPLCNMDNENVQIEQTIPDINKNINTTTVTRSAKEIWFEAFWREYPLKRSKAATKKAFGKVVKNIEDFNYVCEQLTLFRRTQQWKEGLIALRTGGKCYIKHASSWLNSGDYKDDLSEQSTSQASPKVTLNEHGLSPMQMNKFLLDLLKPGESFDKGRLTLERLRHQGFLSERISDWKVANAVR
jgi:hypothetical protein